MFSNLTDNSSDYPKLTAICAGQPLDNYFKTASAALLLNMVYADKKCDPKEIRKSLQTLEKHFPMNSEMESLEIMQTAEEFRRDSARVSEFLAAVKQDFGSAEKQQLLAMIWQIVLADGLVQDEESAQIDSLVAALGLSSAEAEAAKQLT